MALDFGGHYGSQPVAIAFCPGCPASVSVDTHAQQFLAGPQFSYRGQKATAFLHALAGGVHVRSRVAFPLPLPSPPLSISASESSFGMALGGGVDYRLTQELAWRTQADFVTTRLFDRTQNNARISTGLVLRF